MRLKKYLFISVVAIVAVACSTNSKDEKDKPSKSELKAKIKEMEDSLVQLQSDLSTTKQIPNLTHFELINRLLDYYHNYPEDPISAEYLDKVHMKYSGLNIYDQAVKYADTLLMNYPNYKNRALVLESQGSSFDVFPEIRDTAKVRYYYNLLLKENPKMNREKINGIKERLQHLNLTFDQYIDFKMKSFAVN
jgi:tetratricopeptide (TPR) repeat protein